MIIIIVQIIFIVSLLIQPNSRSVLSIETFLGQLIIFITIIGIIILIVISVLIVLVVPVSVLVLVLVFVLVLRCLRKKKIQVCMQFIIVICMIRLFLYRIQLQKRDLIALAKNIFYQILIAIPILLIYTIDLIVIIKQTN